MAGTAAKEGGGHFRGGWGISPHFQVKLFFLHPAGIDSESQKQCLKKYIFGRHTKTKSSDLTCALYALRSKSYIKKEINLLRKFPLTGCIRAPCPERFSERKF